jgi:adenylate kinase family enzyme
MHRVLVVGASGSGKTTVSAELALRLGVSHVELDALHHGPNWSEAGSDEFRARVLAALDTEGWICDGMYEFKLGTAVFERADTVVWLDLPLRILLSRLWCRTKDRIANDVELWNGNRESWRNAFVGRESLFIWTVRRYRRLHRDLPAILSASRLSHLDVVRLRSQEEVTRWMSTQGGDQPEGSSTE